MAPLFVAATPIGNPSDASNRLREQIETADLVAAEDSRKFHRLATDLGCESKPRVISFFDANESDRIPMLISALEAGKNVLLVSDAGTPGVSDPGFRLINECISRSLPLVVIPGASAVTTALLYSGLSTARFAFDGFLPRTTSGLERYFTAVKAEERTCVLFESPRRLERSLQVALKVLGPERRIAICREMTKTYEEIFRGNLERALIWAEERVSGEGIRGEITLVIAPIESESAYSQEEIEMRAKELLEEGLPSKEISMRLSAEFSIPRRQAYDLVNSLRGDGQDA